MLKQSDGEMPQLSGSNILTSWTAAVLVFATWSKWKALTVYSANEKPMKQIVWLRRALSPSTGHDILLFPEGSYQPVSLHEPAGTIF